MSGAVKYQRTLFEPEHALFRESYRGFLDRHVAPYHDEWEKAKIVDRGVWLEAGKQGFLGMSVPEEYGGGGSEDFRFNAVIVEEIAKWGSVCPGLSLQNDVVGPYFKTLATEDAARVLAAGHAGRPDRVVLLALAGHDDQGEHHPERSRRPVTGRA